MGNKSITPLSSKNLTVGKNNSLQTSTNKYNELLIVLDRNARLFAKEKDGTLRRIEASEAKQRLDDGQEVALVKGLGTETHTKEEVGTSYFDLMGFSSYDREKTNMSSRGKEVNVVYTASPLKNWSDLDFTDRTAKGVPGTPTLPQSGGKALISFSWEKTWVTKTESKRANGLFSATEYSGRTNGGNETDSYIPNE